MKRLDKLQRRINSDNTFDVMAADWLRREARRQKWTPGYLIEVESSIGNHLSALNGIPLLILPPPR